MAFGAIVYRVLIASPGDLKEDRQVICDALQEWNHLHSEDKGVVLLPLRWEVNATSRLGMRPQAVVNDQLVVNADFAIAAFWTRLGSPTGVADSGTVEEIEEVHKAGKRVLLYFSRKGADPHSLDTQEFERLKAFKARIQENGLIESYESEEQLRDRLRVGIGDAVKRLQEANPQPKAAPDSSAPATEYLKLVPTPGQMTWTLDSESGAVVMKFSGRIAVTNVGGQPIALLNVEIRTADGTLIAGAVVTILDPKSSVQVQTIHRDRFGYAKFTATTAVMHGTVNRDFNARIEFVDNHENRHSRPITFKYVMNGSPAEAAAIGYEAMKMFAKRSASSNSGSEP